jgi:hypothetical protein
LEEICFSCFLHQEKQQATNGYFFLGADVAAAALFFWLSAPALDCFCEDFFWLAFGDLSPIILFFPQVDSPAEFQFLRRKLHHARRSGHCKWRTQNHFGAAAHNRLQKIVADNCGYSAGTGDTGVVCKIACLFFKAW